MPCQLTSEIKYHRILLQFFFILVFCLNFFAEFCNFFKNFSNTGASRLQSKPLLRHDVVILELWPAVVTHSPYPWQIFLPFQYYYFRALMRSHSRKTALASSAVASPKTWGCRLIIFSQILSTTSSIEKSPCSEAT